MSGARLRRVNHDSSWLLTLPVEGKETEKTTFNLLIDPWLDDSSQIDYHPSFSEQKRTTPAVASSIAELEGILEKEDDTGGKNDQRQPSRQIDGILFSHPFTDHMHPPTLRDPIIAERKIPLLVTSDAKAGLQSILGRKGGEEQRKQIVEIAKADHTRAPVFLSATAATDDDGKLQDYQRDISLGSEKSLPSNVHICQVETQERFSILAGPSAIAWSKLHGGILILWTSPTNSSSSSSSSSCLRHSLLYTPHGIKYTSIPVWLQSPRHDIQHEAILTSLDTITLPKWISGTVNLGLPAVLESIVQDVYPSKRILSTHDERKEARGMVASLLKRYWLGSAKLDSPRDDLAALKRQDQHRQSQAQEMVNSALTPSGKASAVLVLDPNETLTL